MTNRFLTETIHLVDVDSCLVNGVMLGYPCVYVHGQIFYTTVSPLNVDNCLSMVPLHCYELKLAPELMRVSQFTVPKSISQSIVNEQLIGHWKQQNYVANVAEVTLADVML